MVMAIQTSTPRRRWLHMARLTLGRALPAHLPFFRAVLLRLRRGRRAIVDYFFSSLSRRIVILNLAGLAALLFGILYLNQFRAGLIDARVQSLLTQGEIIAAAIAGNATVDDGAIALNPGALVGGDGEDSPGDGERLSFGINPEQVAPLLRRLIAPAKLRARVYDNDGALVVDSSFLFTRGEAIRPDALRPGVKPGLLDQAWRSLRAVFARDDLPRYRELGATEGRGYPEVVLALAGRSAPVVRVNERGELIVSVAVPVQKARSAIGALLLSTQGGDIDAIIDAERLAILRVFAVASAVMLVLSLLLSGSIAGPVRRLAEAAEKVRGLSKARAEIPDFTDRQDEIGHLSGALRDMTAALYGRIEAIERFAADVAHELKNPLTSLRSAVETMPLARTDDQRRRLLHVINHDVRRLDRLITDIADASRLDAELQREQRESIDVGAILISICSHYNDTAQTDGPSIRLTLERHALGARTFITSGHGGRLARVFTNLIDNARSFSHQGGEIRVCAKREGGVIEITVDDDGPGIAAEPIERIFERFYTDRPESAFGNNSGLGLSITKQIVEAHRGRIIASNRTISDGDGLPQVAGARFVVRLPAS